MKIRRRLWERISVGEERWKMVVTEGRYIEVWHCQRIKTKQINSYKCFFKVIKTRGEITTVNLNLVLDNSILDMASKAQATKEKLDKLIFSELNIFVLVHQEIKMYYTKME